VLSRSFAAGRLAGTYLLTGREGTGRWALALATAALANCEAPVTSDEKPFVLKPCGVCRTCRLIFGLAWEEMFFAVPIEKHKSLDEAVELTRQVLDLKRKSPFANIASSEHTSIPISLAREIKRQLSRKASPGVRRTVLFHQMEQMRAQSADALLKLIEEPPEDALILLTAERPEMLLPTIRSRSRLVRLDRVPAAVIADFLREGTNLPVDRAAMLARVCDGSPGRALALAENESQEDLSHRHAAFHLFKSLMVNDAPATVGMMHDLLTFKDRTEVQELLATWQSLIRDCAAFALTGDQGGLTNADVAGDIVRLAEPFRDASLAARMVAEIKITLADLKRSVHIQGALVALVLRIKTGAVAAV